MKPYWLLLKAALITYVGIYLISEGTLRFIIPPESIRIPDEVGNIKYIFTISFLLFATPIIYLANSWIAGKWLKLNINRLFLYMGLTMLFGSALELLVNFLFETAIGRPSWVYHIWPKYGGYTSGVTCIMWPLYGFHILCLHEALKARKSPVLQSIPTKGILLAIDAMIMEVVANLFSLIAFRSYYFYYNFGDLNHFTTIEIFIPYALVGIFTMTLYYFLDRPKIPRALIGILCLLGGWCILYFG